MANSTRPARILRLAAEGWYDLVHPPANNIPFLDVLRSAAILLVFTGHYIGDFRPGLANFFLFRFGWTGVDLFFVLSGYLIGFQLWKELKRNGDIRIGRFLLRRGLRIWPLYYGVAILVALGFFFGQNISALWSDLLYASNMFHNRIQGGWSLSTEEQFYTIAPILLTVYSWLIAPRRMWIAPLLALGSVIATRAWIIHHSLLPEAALLQKLYFPIFTHADGLAVGFFLAWIAVFKVEWQRSKLFTVVVAPAMVLCGLALYRVNPLLLNFTALGLIYGALELYGVSSLLIPGIFRWRGFYFVSRLSYGLYLNHMAVLGLLVPLLGKWSRHGSLGLGAAYLACLFVGLAVASFSFVLIEWPFLKLRSQWLDRRAARADAVPTKIMVVASGHGAH